MKYKNIETNNESEISHNNDLSKQDEKFKNVEKCNYKKHSLMWMIAFIVTSVFLAVSVAFNLISLCGIYNKECCISVTTLSDKNTLLNDQNLLLGENYVCTINMLNVNRSYVEKIADVKIVVKKANVILEKGNFKNISFDDFSYNENMKFVEADKDICVKGFSSEDEVIRFNFCPTQIGTSCLKIEIYLEDKLIESCEFTVEL